MERFRSSLGGVSARIDAHLGTLDTAEFVQIRNAVAAVFDLWAEGRAANGGGERSPRTGTTARLLQREGARRPFFRLNTST